MLIGEYKHSIDSKKRLALPSKLRKKLGGKAVITRGLDKCLFVYPVNEWAKFAESLASLPMGQSINRSFSRLFLSGAMDVETDKLGRILIPEYLKEYAQLGDQVVIVGMYRRLEIWSPEKWKRYSGEMEQQADVLAEKLGELGAY